MAKKTMAKSEATRQTLSDAALTVIGRHGYAGATVEKIAEEAGVSKGVVYYYFKTKADIATSVLTDSFEKVVDEFEQVMMHEESTHDTMIVFVRTFAAKIFGNREASRFILSEIWRDDRIWSNEMRKIEDRLIEMLEHCLQNAMDNGTIRPEIDKRFVSIAIIGTVLTSAQYYLMLDDADYEEAFANHCIDFIHHALSAQ
ncbi:MAG: TetR family transcriptional regulator [Eggerthellaceae bacterium]